MSKNIPQRYHSVSALLLSAILLAVILLIGNSTAYAVQARTSSLSSGRITAILQQEQNLFWEKTWDGLREESLALGYGLSEYQVTSTESIADYLEIALLTRPDGIIFNPSLVHDESTKKLLQQIYDAGIPLVSLDTEYSELPVQYLGIDNVACCKVIADYIAKNSTEEELYLLTYDTNRSSALNIRLESLSNQLQALGFQDRLKLLTLPNDKNDVELREFLDERLLQIDQNAILICIAPKQTLYAAKTVAAHELQEQFRVVGFGESQEAIELLKSGAIEALMLQNNRQMGCLAIQYLDDLLSGNAAAEGPIYIDNSLYTRENIDF